MVPTSPEGMQPEWNPHNSISMCVHRAVTWQKGAAGPSEVEYQCPFTRNLCRSVIPSPVGRHKEKTITFGLGDSPSQNLEMWEIINSPRYGVFIINSPLTQQQWKWHIEKYVWSVYESQPAWSSAHGLRGKQQAGTHSALLQTAWALNKGNGE